MNIPQPYVTENGDLIPQFIIVKNEEEKQKLINSIIEELEEDN